MCALLASLFSDGMLEMFVTTHYPRLAPRISWSEPLAKQAFKLVALLRAEGLLAKPQLYALLRQERPHRADEIDAVERAVQQPAPAPSAPTPLAPHARRTLRRAAIAALLLVSAGWLAYVQPWHMRAGETAPATTTATTVAATTTAAPSAPATAAAGIGSSKTTPAKRATKPAPTAGAGASDDTATTAAVRQPATHYARSGSATCHGTRCTLLLQSDQTLDPSMPVVCLQPANRGEFSGGHVRCLRNAGTVICNRSDATLSTELQPPIGWSACN